MSIKCQKLARNCNRFGVKQQKDREVYKCIADHASPGARKKKSKDDKTKHLPEDWTSIGYARIMMECNITRTQTVTDILRSLANAGAIEIKEVADRKMFRFDSVWAEAHQWTNEDMESFRCLASERYANRMLEKSSQVEDFTTDSVGDYNGQRCDDDDLQRTALGTTTDNRTVTHSTELTALQKIVSHHTGVNSSASPQSDVSVSTEQLEGSGMPSEEPLSEDEEMMKIWAEGHPKSKNGFSWSNFCHSDKTFRNGCLKSKAFRDQYRKAVKNGKVPLPKPEDDYNLSVNFGD